MKAVRNIVAVLALILFVSCEKILFEEDLASKDPFVNFDYLWEECDKKYAYFKLKNVDWRKVRQEKRGMLYVGMSQDSLFKVLGSMLSELKDDHANLISNFNVSRFGVKYLGQDNFDWRIIEDNYIGKDYYVSGPFKHAFLQNKEIGYVRFASFRGDISGSNLGFVLNRYKDTKGLVLDLRENGGGAVTDIFALLSRFVEEKTLLSYSRIKKGAEHDDFTAPEPVYLEPTSDIRYKNKVVLLVDRGTYSAGSFTALSTKAMPNVVLMGDTTGGGLGLPNGGQLPNGWTYRFSITQALSLDNKPDYENGVPPDISAFLDWNNRKKDEILERAIQELL